MRAGHWSLRVALVVAASGLSGCVTRTWEDKYAVTEAVPPVGTHHRRTYKYGEEVPPSVSPRVKIEGEGLRLLLDQMRVPSGR